MSYLLYCKMLPLGRAPSAHVELLWAGTGSDFTVLVPAIPKGLWALCNAVKLHRSHFHPRQQGFRSTNPPEGLEADVCH